MRINGTEYSLHTNAVCKSVNLGEQVVLDRSQVSNMVKSVKVATSTRTFELQDTTAAFYVNELCNHNVLVELVEDGKTVIYRIPVVIPFTLMTNEHVLKAGRSVYEVIVNCKCEGTVLKTISFLCLDPYHPVAGKVLVDHQLSLDDSWQGYFELGYPVDCTSEDLGRIELTWETDSRPGRLQTAMLKKKFAQGVSFWVIAGGDHVKQRLIRLSVQNNYNSIIEDVKVKLNTNEVLRRGIIPKGACSFFINTLDPKQVFEKEVIFERADPSSNCTSMTITVDPMFTLSFKYSSILHNIPREVTISFGGDDGSEGRLLSDGR